MKTPIHSNFREYQPLKMDKFLSDCWIKQYNIVENMHQYLLSAKYIPHPISCPSKNRMIKFKKLKNNNTENKDIQRKEKGENKMNILKDLSLTGISVIADNSRSFVMKQIKKTIHSKGIELRNRIGTLIDIYGSNMNSTEYIIRAFNLPSNLGAPYYKFRNHVGENGFVPQLDDVFKIALNEFITEKNHRKITMADSELVQEAYYTNMNYAYDNFVLIHPCEKTYMIVYIISKYSKDDAIMINNNTDIKCYPVIYVFGKHRKAVIRGIRRLIVERLRFPNNEPITRVKNMTVDLNVAVPSDIDHHITYIERVDTCKDIKNNFIWKNNIKRAIINAVNIWIKNRDIYTSYGIKYKLGILLYGEPGTGKSTLAEGIAAYVKNLVLNDDKNPINNVYTFYLNVTSSRNITAAIIEAQRTIAEHRGTALCIFIIDDIDICMGATRNEEKTPEEKERFHALLQFLDGSSSLNNSISIATTNRINELKEHFDGALLREGRFDVKVPIDKFDREQADEMCQLMDTTIDKIEKLAVEETDDEITYPVSPVKIQNLALSKIKRELKDSITVEM